MGDLTALTDQFDPEKGSCRAVIETPRGKRNKFDYDPSTGLFMLGGLLPEGMAFPCDFGFIPGTLGDDGDPLDVIVLMDAPAHVGCLLGCIRSFHRRAVSARHEISALAAGQSAAAISDEAGEIRGYHPAGATDGMMTGAARALQIVDELCVCLTARELLGHVWCLHRRGDGTHSLTGLVHYWRRSSVHIKRRLVPVSDGPTGV
jgi:hypothetical protein